MMREKAEIIVISLRATYNWYDRFDAERMFLKYWNILWLTGTLAVLISFLR